MPVLNIWNTMIREGRAENYEKKEWGLQIQYPGKLFWWIAREPMAYPICTIFSNIPRKNGII